MELREEEFTKEQLQQITEFLSKNQTSCLHLPGSNLQLLMGAWAWAFALVEVRCVPQLVVRGAVKEEV